MSRKKYLPRVAHTVKGGIRSQRLTGPQRVWWSRRWTEVLEEFRMGARFGRGRSYAATGQVSRLDITPGKVSASVQGAAPEPYYSEIKFQTVIPGKHEQLRSALQRNPMVVARILVGDLPTEVEALFLKEGCQLFPQRRNDLQSRCTCPDYANPCKHLAAIYCLLGDEITRNPLLLLTLRGITHSDLIAPLLDKELPTIAVEPALQEPSEFKTDFYGSSAVAQLKPMRIKPGVLTAPLLQRLGALPLWRGQERFVETMEQIYARAAIRGTTVWNCEPLDLRRESEKVVIKGGTLQLKHRILISE